MRHVRRVLAAAAAAVCIHLALPPVAMAGQPRYDPTLTPRPSLPAVRATGTFTIDGNLDERDWTNAPVATNFIQSEPREGEPAVDQTEVRILYDDTNIYIGAFLHDPEPEGIVIPDLKKDWAAAQADYFAVIVDTFHDKRNLYDFAVNAGGAKWDSQATNEGRDNNLNWDGIWSAAARIAEDGWYAEMAIPFRTVRSPTTDPQTWGLQLSRRNRHRNEDSQWAPVGRVFGVFRISMAGTLVGLSGIDRGRDLRIKPYVVGSGSQVGRGTVAGSHDVGIDVKYGVAGGLTWDFTVNTDFSQVEADEQQINLTRFSLFFPEKRDFFLENSGVFQFGPTTRISGPAGVVERQNAISNDAILFFSRNIGLSTTGQVIPILGGTRLTGRTGRNTIGALNIEQRHQNALPATNFTALRLRRDVLRNSDIGVLFLNKDVRGPLFNRTIGADANFRFYRNLNLAAFFAHAVSPESVVGGVGRNNMAHASVTWRDQRWDLRAMYLTIGERFRDEMGFMPRIGIDKGEVQFGAHLRPKAVSRWLREAYPHWQGTNVMRRAGGLDSRYLDYHLPFTFQNSAILEAGVNTNTEDLLRPFAINPRRQIAVAPGRYDFTEYFVLFAGNPSAPVSLNARYASGDFYNGDKREYQGGISVRLSEHLNASSTLTRTSIDLSAGSYTTQLLTSRVNVSFSTRIFLNALIQYNSDAQQWSSNVRFNVIHRPLSDFFLVYNDRRDSATGVLADRALVAKLTYLVAF